MAKDKQKATTAVRPKKYFSAYKEPLTDMLDFVEPQRTSFQWLIEEGIKETLKEFETISDYSGKKFDLKIKGYEILEPKYDEYYAKRNKLSYEAPLNVKVELYNKVTGTTKEQEIFMTDFPLMTEHGTFIISGIERVIVPQLARIPVPVLVLWSTLDRFQRTRGVLRLMATVIHSLWTNNDQSLMIMPSSIPLWSATVRNEMLRYLPENWPAIVDADIDAQVLHWDDVPAAVGNGECPTATPDAEPILDGVVGILPIAAARHRLPGRVCAASKKSGSVSRRCSLANRWQPSTMPYAA